MFQNRGAYPIGNGLASSSERFARQFSYPGDRVCTQSESRIYFDEGLEALNNVIPDDIPDEYQETWQRGFDRQMNEAKEFTSRNGGDLTRTAHS